MSAKQESYIKEDKNDGFKKGGMDDLNERLAADLRSQVRRLGNYQVFSSNWIEMVQSLNRIANVSDMEVNLPQAKDNATLWETDEQAIRFVLEDGKLNLCVRSMTSFRQHLHDKKHSTDLLGFEKCIDDFEKGMGALLKNAWVHIEAVQITDLQAVLEHINAVILHSLEDNGARLSQLLENGKLEQVQEGFLYYYMHLFLKDVEDLGEGRIMPIVRSLGIFMNLVHSIMRSYQGMSEVLLNKALETLSFIVQSEDFATYREEYLGDDNAGFNLDLLLELQKKLLKPIMKELPAEKKKVLRPLSDAIDKTKRILGNSKK